MIILVLIMMFVAIENEHKIALFFYCFFFYGTDSHV